MRHRTVSRPIQTATCVSGLALFQKWLVVAGLLLAPAASAPTQAQSPAQTPFLFVSTPVSQTQDGIITLLRDPHSGTLTMLPAATSTFKDRRIPEAMEPQGQFLFGTCGDGLAMYSFDSTSGAVQEIATSPYAISSGPTLYPFLVAPESTSQFVYLLKFSAPTVGAVTYTLDKFQIDRTTPQLVPLTTQILPIGSSVVGAAADPSFHGSVVVATDTSAATSAVTPMAYVITFNPTTGAESIPAGGTIVPGTTPTAFALSPQGKYFALGSTSRGFKVAPVSNTTRFTMWTTTFDILGTPFSFLSPPGGSATTQPLSLSFDPLAGLLYVQYANSGLPPQNASPFETYQVPELAHVDTLLFEQGNILFTGVVDPDAPYRYESIAGTPPQGIGVWLIDPGTGFPLQPASLANPFFPTLNLNPIFASFVAASSGQNLTGPFL